MNIKLKVLYPRRFTGQDGQEATHWMQVGRGFMNDKGIDVQLWVAPLPNADGHIRLVLREDDGRPAQAEGQYRGQEGGRARVAQAAQGWQGGKHAPPGPPNAPEGPGLRPQHRDGLQGAQGALYGGAAAKDWGPERGGGPEGGGPGSSGAP